MQDSLTTEGGAPDPHRRQYTTMAIVAVVLGSAVSWFFGMQSPAVIAGLTAVFALVACGGQSLTSDLRRFSWFSVPLVLVMAGGPLLRDVPVLAGLLAAVVVFGAGMLPALGERYRIVGQSFATATLVSTATGIGEAEPAALLLAAAAIGLGFALILRILTGLSDPAWPTRVAVASTLTTPGPGVVERAARVWRSDGATGWLGEVLAGAARFRAARETLLAQAERAGATEADRLHQIVAEADLAAGELAKAIRARACTGLPPLARMNPAEAALSQDGRQHLPAAVDSLNRALDRIRAAVVSREGLITAPPTPGGRKQRALGALRANLSPRSSLFRHSLRCTIAVAVGMTIVLLLRDPSASSLLLGLYVVLQPAARDSMTGALERTGGAVLGVVALAIVITLLPGAYLLVPLVILGMLLGVEKLREDYQVLLGAVLSVIVVDQAMVLERPLVNVAISFASNTAVGAAIALGIGYVSYLVLPSSLVPDVRGAVRSTVWAVSELLRSVRAAGRGAELHTALNSAHILALRRTQDLIGMPALLDGTSTAPDDAQVTREAAVSLDALRQDVATLAFRPEAEQSVAIPALRAVDDLLVGRTETKIPDVTAETAPATELLASSLIENALHARAAIDRTLGVDSPWKKYTISFVRTEHLRIR